MHLTLIERNPPVARGLAYRIWDDSMLLNVPAGNMSALADEPGHFRDYCRDIDPAFNAGSFVPRRLFGDYLEHTLAAAERQGEVPLTRLRAEAEAEAVGVRRGADARQFEISLADGGMLLADRVVLALGHLGAQRLRFADPLLGSGRYIGNPWDYAEMDHIPAGQPVLVVGTGHTAIDAIFRLSSRDDERKVILLSRRGLLPKGHRTLPQAPATTVFPSYLEALPPTALAHLRAVRREVRMRQIEGGNWRDVINALRPHTPEIWRRLPDRERRRFLARVAPWWDIHRHRLAPSAARRLRAMLQSGQAEVVAGRVLEMRRCGQQVEVRVQPRSGGEPRELEVAAVVNCTGPDYDIGRLDASALVSQLRDEGYIRADRQRIGIEADDGYRVVDARGEAVQGLHYVGPMLRARYWEAIAVPELRRHAQDLVRWLLASRP